MTAVSDLGEAAGRVVPERVIEEVIRIIDPGGAPGHRTSRAATSVHSARTKVRRSTRSLTDRTGKYRGPADKHPERVCAAQSRVDLPPGWWSGAGSNCRPSAFQELCHPESSNLEKAPTTQLTRIDADDRPFSVP